VSWNLENSAQGAKLCPRGAVSCDADYDSLTVRTPRMHPSQYTPCLAQRRDDGTVYLMPAKNYDSSELLKSAHPALRTAS